MHESGESLPLINNQPFEKLDENYCSLGNKVDYYSNLYQYLGAEMAARVAEALQDCAVDMRIHERYRDNDVFNSSLRRDSIPTEEALRLGRFYINGRGITDVFRFAYYFNPDYNSACVTEWKVEFNTKSKPYERIAGVIGENGVGKTLMLHNFIKDLTEAKTDKFEGSLPIYSTIIAICSTPFDKFMEIESVNRLMPYEKCCLEQNTEETRQKVLQGVEIIKRRGVLEHNPLMHSYVEKVRQAMPTENVDEVFVYHNSGMAVLRHYEINQEKLGEFLEKLSSGQLHTLMLLTYVYEHIYTNALFVIDEPEVHLHPNAIISFMKLLYELLDEFRAYAIVTTHSPLVVREMLGRNVFLLRRLEENNVYIGHVAHETFGEDMAILYRDIFGYDDTVSCFREIIGNLIERYEDFDEVVNHLQLEGLSLASRFTIKGMVDAYKKRKEANNEE